jgi:hypothetical protein
VSEATLLARKRAHEQFDRLWQGCDTKMTRGEAYHHLSVELGIPPKRCHFSMMSEVEATRAALWATHTLVKLTASSKADLKRRVELKRKAVARPDCKCREEDAVRRAFLDLNEDGGDPEIDYGDYRW